MDYGGKDDKQCRADKKDCEIQPDQRSDEKTWADCDENLCFDTFGCELEFESYQLFFLIVEFKITFFTK